MWRCLLVALALTFGVHHMAVAGPAAGPAHHEPVCATCEHDGASHDTGGLLLAGCVGLIATIIGVPAVRRRLLSRWVPPQRIVRHGWLPGPPPHRSSRPPGGPAGLCVLRR